MKKPLIIVLGMAALALSLGLTVSADQPAAKRTAAVAPTAAKSAASRITHVTVYPNSALVTREVETPAGAGTFELVVSPLPPMTVESSLFSESSDGVRVLSTRYRTRPIREDTREEVRKLEDELRSLAFASQKLQAELQAAQQNQHLFTKLEDFTANSNKTGDKTPVNSESIIALTKYVTESRALRAKEIVGLQQDLELNKEQAEFVRRQLRDLTAGTTRVEHDGVIVIDKVNAAAGKVRLNYLVGAASWRPQYKFRAGAGEKEAVQLEYLAAVLQHTGEDWAGVQLVLSTAQPTLNAAPPDLQVLQVRVVPPGGATPVAQHPNTMELEERVRSLRSQAQKDFNERRQTSGIGLFNTAAALDQSWELLNPEAAVKRGCSFASKEGPSVTYHLKTALTVPSRNDEQIIEVARIDMQPQYYYKAVPVLTSHIYRLADLTNRSNYVLLPGEATMYIGADFVGQMNLPLVAIGEQFTAGFGVDPQLQIQRLMTDRSRATQGGNQVLRYEYRLLLNSYKSERAMVQVWDRLPFAENDTVGVSLLHTTPELSKDALYLREQRPSNLLRWDVWVEPGMSAEKALPIAYEFKLDLDRQMTIGSFQTAGVAAPAPPTMVERTHTPIVAAVASEMETKINANLAKLSPEDRKLAQAQVFCALDQESPLGSMGTIYKVMCKGTPVFLCCKGCESEARTNPDHALAELNKLRARMNSARK